VEEQIRETMAQTQGNIQGKYEVGQLKNQKSLGKFVISSGKEG
jgi:hypothetical protein